VKLSRAYLQAERARARLLEVQGSGSAPASPRTSTQAVAQALGAAGVPFYSRSRRGTVPGVKVRDAALSPFGAVSVLCDHCAEGAEPGARRVAEVLTRAGFQVQFDPEYGASTGVVFVK